MSGRFTTDENFYFTLKTPPLALIAGGTAIEMSPDTTTSSIYLTIYRPNGTKYVNDLCITASSLSSVYGVYTCSINGPTPLNYAYTLKVDSSIATSSANIGRWTAILYNRTYVEGASTNILDWDVDYCDIGNSYQTIYDKITDISGNIGPKSEIGGVTVTNYLRNNIYADMAKNTMLTTVSSAVGQVSSSLVVVSGAVNTTKTQVSDMSGNLGPKSEIGGVTVTNYLRNNIYADMAKQTTLTTVSSTVNTVNAKLGDTGSALGGSSISTYMGTYLPTNLKDNVSNTNTTIGTVSTKVGYISSSITDVSGVITGTIAPSVQTIEKLTKNKSKFEPGVFRVYENDGTTQMGYWRCYSDTSFVTTASTRANINARGPFVSSSTGP